MKITINCDDQNLILSTEDLNNLNYVDMEIWDDEKFIKEITVPIDELKAAVDAFTQIKRDNDERDKLYGKE
jgi:hypothetical protein